MPGKRKEVASRYGEERNGHTRIRDNTASYPDAEESLVVIVADGDAHNGGETVDLPTVLVP